MRSLWSALELIRRLVLRAPALGVAVAVFPAACIFICPGASAAATWLSPASLSAAGHSSNAPQAAVDPAGEGVAAWSFYNGSHSVIQASVRPASGAAWQAPVTLSEASHESEHAEIAIDPNGEAIAVWALFNGSHWVIQASVRPYGGSWQTPVNLSEVSYQGYSPQIAFNPDGEAIVVWETYNGSHAFIQASVRPASGGGWQTPVNLSETGHEAYVPQLVINAQGEAVAVWEFNNGSYQVVQAAARPPGSSWQTPVSLSASGQYAEEPQVAVNSKGEAVAGWQLSSGSKEDVQASVRPTPAGAWQTPVTIAEGEMSIGDLEQRVAIDGQGNAFAVWSQSSGPVESVKASVRPVSGSWQTPVQLAGQTAQEPRVAVGAHGEAVALWSYYNGNYTAVQASELAGPSGSWTSPQNLSEAGPSAFEPGIAVNSQGNAFALWNLSNGSDSVIQAAAHVAAGPLQSEVSIPASATIGQSLSFSVTPLDAWASLGQTSWSFGDGKTANGASTTHTYAAPGSYEVVVKSADALGNITTKTWTVLVEAPAVKGSPAKEVAGSSTAATTTTATTTTGIGAAAASLLHELLTKAPQPLINARSLILKLACGGSACSTSVSGWVKLPGAHQVWHLGGFSGALAPNAVGKVRVWVPRQLRHAVRSYLRRHPHYEVMVHLTVALSVNRGAPESVTAALPVWTYPGFR